MTWWVALVAGAAGMAGATGCFLRANPNDGASSDSAQTATAGDLSRVLKSTLVLTDAGCTATKIGPRHLLVSARCVTGNTAFDVGNVLQYTIAQAQKPAIIAAPPAQAPAADDDAGAPSDASAPTTTATDAGTAADAGATTTSDPNTSSVAIVEEVKINEAWSTKCKTPEVCNVGKVGAGDAPDVAVVILKDNLDIVPTVPVDLDAVGEGDQLTAVSSGCSAFDDETVGSPKIAKTVAVPARLAKHKGSPYVAASQLLTTFGNGYVVTPGVGWLTGGDKLCKRDLGAPIFRTNAAAVIGIASSFTVYDQTKLAPVTVAHTRLDATTRFKVGSWLKTLGAETVHSCSESAGGCTHNAYDGGAPDDGTTAEGDGGTLADGGDAGFADAGSTAPSGSDAPHSEPLPTGDDDSYSDYSGEEDYSDAGVEAKKKKKDTGGCNAAPGELPTGELVLAFGLGLAVIIARRRRGSV